jgi:hypothetical protein
VPIVILMCHGFRARSFLGDGELSKPEMEDAFVNLGIHLDPDTVTALFK